MSFHKVLTEARLGLAYYTEAEVKFAFLEAEHA
jgi:hypothetical protein